MERYNTTKSNLDFFNIVQTHFKIVVHFIVLDVIHELILIWKHGNTKTKNIFIKEYFAKTRIK